MFCYFPSHQRWGRLGSRGVEPGGHHSTMANRPFTLTTAAGLGLLFALQADGSGEREPGFRERGHHGNDDLREGGGHDSGRFDRARGADAAARGSPRAGAGRGAGTHGDRGSQRRSVQPLRLARLRAHGRVRVPAVRVREHEGHDVHILVELVVDRRGMLRRGRLPGPPRARLHLRLHQAGRLGDGVGGLYQLPVPAVSHRRSQGRRRGRGDQ